MRTPRGLSDEEAAAWARLAATVTPYHPPQPGEGDHAKRGGGAGATKSDAANVAAVSAAATSKRPTTARVSLHQPPAGPSPRSRDDGLDSHWERRLRSGSLAPDFTLDLHEHSLDAAYQRLLGGLDIARETGARVVLVIAGRERPTHAADRAGSRGAIRAKLLDWLAASRHASAIAAIRKAHRRHGGEGALCVILKKGR
jgi:DNA-nicking Smr family endonuclease